MMRYGAIRVLRLRRRPYATASSYFVAHVPKPVEINVAVDSEAYGPKIYLE